MPTDDRRITELLQLWSGGDEDALDELMPLVFEDLRSMARGFFRDESDTHTLQATVLVSELYFQLKKRQKTTWENRKAFFAFAAEVMRHFLVDYARKRGTAKRGSRFNHVALGTIASMLGRENTIDLVIDLQMALENLEQLDAEQAKVVEMRFLLGLTVKETAKALGVSEPTVKRKFRTSKLWLMRRLSSPVPQPLVTLGGDPGVEDGDGPEAP